MKVSNNKRILQIIILLAFVFSAEASQVFAQGSGGSRVNGESSVNCEQSNAAQLQEAAQAPQNQQQMVPTNPIPIVDPIKSIEANIKRIAAKEIGSKEDGNKPSLDAVSACEVDKMILKVTEASQKFIWEGGEGDDEGDPGKEMFIGDYNLHFSEVRITKIEEFTKALKENDTCGGELYKNISKALVEEENARSIINSDKSKACLPDEQKGEDEDDLNKIENLFSWLHPENNTIYQKGKATRELRSVVNSELERVKLESEISLGFKSIKNDEGRITTPAGTYLEQSLANLGGAKFRVNQYQEVGYSKVLDDVFKKVHIGSPEKQNSPTQNNNVPRNLTINNDPQDEL
jgi:hypothetical protein